MTQSNKPSLSNSGSRIINDTALAGTLARRMREEKASGRPYAALLSDFLAGPYRDDPTMSAAYAKALTMVL